MRQISTNRLFVTPSHASGVSVTPSGTAWANSAWVEIFPAADAAYAIYGAVIETTAGDFVPTSAELEFGVGAAGAEAAVGVLAVAIGGNWGINMVSHADILLPIGLTYLASGQRGSVRVRKQGTHTNAWRVSLLYYKLPLSGTMMTSSNAAIAIPAAANAVVVPAAADWAEGTWTTMLAATASDVLVLGIAMSGDDNVNRRTELEIGDDNGGAKTVRAIVSDVQRNTPSVWPHWCSFEPFTVLSGHQISCRARHSAASARNVRVKMLAVPV